MSEPTRPPAAHIGSIEGPPPGAQIKGAEAGSKALAEQVRALHTAPGPEDGWFSCCGHCGCLTGDRIGHDDTCSFGCNDRELARATT